MENGQTDYASDEFEVVEMLGIDAGMGIDLEGIIIVGGVFEKTVKRVKHFVRQEEEKFSAGLLIRVNIRVGMRGTNLERPP